MAIIHLLTDLKTHVERRSSRERAIFVAGGTLALVLLLADQFSKIWAERSLAPHNRVIEVIPSFFNLRFATNKGAAWGIFDGHTLPLFLVAVVVLAAAAFYFRRLAEGWPERYYALLIILSGVVGNAFDRLWRGHVVDFLDFVFGTYHFPTFNIADSAICCGAAIYLLSSWLRPNGNKGDRE